MSFGVGTPEDLTLTKKNFLSQTDVNILEYDWIKNYFSFIILIILSMICIEKLNKFCELIYKVFQIYPIKSIKCLLLFYNSLAKLIISYGIMTYGSATELNFEKNDTAREKYDAQFSFKNEYDSVSYMFEWTEQNLDCLEVICNGTFQRIIKTFESGIFSPFTYWRWELFIFYKKKPAGTTNNYVQSHCHYIEVGLK